MGRFIDLLARLADRMVETGIVQLGLGAPAAAAPRVDPAVQFEEASKLLQSRRRLEREKGLRVMHSLLRSKVSSDIICPIRDLPSRWFQNASPQNELPRRSSV